MKKFLYTIVWVSLISGLTAMDHDNSDQKKEDPQTTQTTQALDSAEILEKLLSDPENVEVKKSGFLGRGESAVLVKKDAVSALFGEHVRKHNLLLSENECLRTLLEQQDTLEAQNKALLKEIEALQGLKQQNAILSGQLDLVKGHIFDVNTAQRALKLKRQKTLRRKRTLNCKNN